MASRIAVVTNVTQFGGPPSAQALLCNDFQVVCHDRGFANDEKRETFAKANPNLAVAEEQDAEALIAAVTERFGPIDVLVSNDCHPARFSAIDQASIDEYRATLENLLVFPFALIKAVAPQMKDRRQGQIILVSSATPLAPYLELSMYVSARGGANTLTVALARELSPFNIQINAIAPNFLESPIYYPKALWENEPAYINYLKAHVPSARLGQPEELGELVVFLASGKCGFVTGQIIPFTGGWPAVPPLPVMPRQSE